MKVHSTAEAPTTTVRLARTDAVPLRAHFEQVDRAIVGRVDFTANCLAETRQLVHQQKERQRVSAGWVALGAVGAAAILGGLYLVSKSDGANKTEHCGYRASEARSQCDSEASILREEGAGLLIAGAGLTTWGAMMTAQSKHTERQPLPDVQTVHVRASQPCGNVSALEGLGVAVLLPRFGGKWAGRVNADGSARIELPPRLSLPHGAAVSVFVDSVPEALFSLVAPGSSLAQVTLN